MPLVIYRLLDHSERRIEVPEGTSIMNGAVQNDVEGIEAECGGSCACATCHVYVDASFVDRLPPPSELETELLSVVAAERKSNSRLSCQLVITAALDGIGVTMPETQCL